MKKSLIIIFAIIVTIHIIAISILMLQKKSDNKEITDSTIESIPEPTINHDINKINEIKTQKSIKNLAASNEVWIGNKLLRHDASIGELNPLVGLKSKKTERTKNISKKNQNMAKHRTNNHIKPKQLNYTTALYGNIDKLPESKSVKAGILVDMDKGSVIWSKNSKKSVPIASMTKMMTILLILDDIEKGKITPSTMIKVTKKSSRVGGSDVWLDPRETFPLSELMKAIIIKSANDAAYLVAENSGDGDISKFITRMNKKSKEMGLKSAYFANPHGLPIKGGKDNSATCEELVYIANELLNYPNIIQLASTKLAYLPRKIGKVKNTQLLNTNKLIRKNIIGVDGMKTGYTRNAGSCIAITCKRNNRRLIAILAGCSSSKLRDSFAIKLLDWGYNN